MDLPPAQFQPVIDATIASGIDEIGVQSHVQGLGNERLLATKPSGSTSSLAPARTRAPATRRTGDRPADAADEPTGSGAASRDCAHGRRGQAFFGSRSVDQSAASAASRRVTVMTSLTASILTWPKNCRPAAGERFWPSSLDGAFT